MAPPWKILALSASLLLMFGPVWADDATGPHDHDLPKDMCKYLLEKFSDSISTYTRCLTKFARPIRLCLRCRDDYLVVLRDFEDMKSFKQDNITCATVLTKQDRLNIIDNMYQFNAGPNSMWKLASCENCYQDNDEVAGRSGETETFLDLWHETLVCFSKFIDIDFDEKTGHMATVREPFDLLDGNLCVNCSDVYDRMRHYFWNEVIYSTKPKSLTGVCYDLRDAFNMTGIIWRNTFNCEPKNTQWVSMLAVALPAILCIALTYTFEPYFLPYLFANKALSKVQYVRQDPMDWKTEDLPRKAVSDPKNSDVDGKFLVLPGVTAEEYAKTLETKSYTTEDGEEFSMRLPPPPEKIYDMEFDNDEWVVPPKEVFEKMADVYKLQENGEIDQAKADILLCRIIVDELRKTQMLHRPGNIDTTRNEAEQLSDDVEMLSESPN